MCQPAAGIDRNRQLLILLANTNVLPRPEEDGHDKKDKTGKKRGHEVSKELGKEAGKADPAKPQTKEPEPTLAITKEAVKHTSKDVPKEALQKSTADTKPTVISPAPNTARPPLKETQAP